MDAVTRERITQFREIAILVLIIFVSWLADTNVEKAPAPQPVYDEAMVLAIGNPSNQSHPVRNAAFPVADVGFRVEVRTQVGKPSEEMQLTTMRNKFAEREHAEKGFEQLLLVYYWPDLLQVRHVISKNLPQDLDPSSTVAHNVAELWERVNRGRGQSTHIAIVENYIEHIRQGLPENHRNKSYKWTQSRFVYELVLAGIAISIVTMILALLILSNRSEAADAPRDLIPELVVSIALIPLFIAFDYSIRIFIESLGAAAPVQQSVLWLAGGLVVSACFYIFRLPSVGAYIVSRHVPLVFITLGFQQNHLAASVALFVIAIAMTWAMNRFLAKREFNLSSLVRKVR